MTNFLQKTKKTILTLAIMLTISSSAFAQSVTWSGTKTFTANTTIDTDIKLDGIVTVDVAEGVWVQLNGTISNLIAASSITKTGAGDLCLSATSQATYTGPTIINAGTFWYYGLFSQMSIINNAHLVIGHSWDAVYHGVISGTGQLTKHGVGKLVLTGENTYQGVTVIDAGTLQIGNGSTGSIKNTAGVHIFEPGTLHFEPGEDCVFSAGIGGEGKVEYVGNNDKKLFFTANNSYTGTTTIDGGGVIYIGNGGTTGGIVGDIINNDSWLSFNRSDDYIYSGIISGNGSITKWGAGKAILIGENTYTGKTAVFNGTLQIGNGASGSISYTSIVEILYDVCILRFEPGEPIDFWRDITGAGSLECKGEGTEKGLGLYGTNTYTGTTTNEEGNLVIGCWWTGSGSIASNSIINHGILHFDHGDAEYTYSGVISGTGQVHIRNAKTTLKGNNTYTGETQVIGKVLKLDGTIENSAIHLLENSKLDVSAGNKTIKNLCTEINSEVILGSSTLTIDGGGWWLGKFSGSGGVTKTGTSGYYMSAENTATGMFSLNGGTVEFSKSWAGNFTQATGTNLVVNGNAVIGGTCLLMGGQMSMDLTAETPSKLIVMGAASATGTTTLNITSTKITDYVLMQAASGLNNPPSAFTVFAPGLNATLSANGTQLLITVDVADDTPPTPGTGLNGSAQATEATITWETATDDFTPKEYLRYFVYQSASNNITTPADCETNGTLLNAGGTVDIATFTIKELTANTTYYFNVVVSDMAGNKAAYIPKELKTLSTGIASASLSNQILVYPNPASDVLHVTSNGLQVLSVEIYDVMGRMQKNRRAEEQNGEMVLDVSDLNAGVYFLRITTESGVVTKKVIKQ